MNTLSSMVRVHFISAIFGANELQDCWMADKRSKSGDLLPDTHRFPSGIQPLADTIHSMGLKFGIYESAGYTTCQHLPGSLGMYIHSPFVHYN
jgi:hypothetical protein